MMGNKKYNTKNYHCKFCQNKIRNKKEL